MLLAVPLCTCVVCVYVCIYFVASSLANEKCFNSRHELRSSMTIIWLDIRCNVLCAQMCLCVQSVLCTNFKQTQSVPDGIASWRAMPQPNRLTWRMTSERGMDRPNTSRPWARPLRSLAATRHDAPPSGPRAACSPSRPPARRRNCHGASLDLPCRAAGRPEAATPPARSMAGSARSTLVWRPEAAATVATSGERAATPTARPPAESARSALIEIRGGGPAAP